MLGLLESVMAGSLMWLSGPDGVAAAPPLDVVWNAPSDCPSSSDVHRRIVALAEDRSTQGVVVVADVRDLEHGYTAALRVVARSGSTQRQLHAQTCDAIADAAALVVAMTLPNRQAEPVESPPALEGPRIPDAGTDVSRPATQGEFPAQGQLEPAARGRPLDTVGPRRSALRGAVFAEGLLAVAGSPRYAAGVGVGELCFGDVLGSKLVHGTFLSAVSIVALNLRSEFDGGRWRSELDPSSSWARWSCYSGAAWRVGLPAPKV